MTRKTGHSRRPTPEDRRFLEALSAAERRMRTLRISDDRMRRRFVNG